jgi:hypothetical protein
MGMNASGDSGSQMKPIVSLLEISRVLDETARLLREHPAAALEEAPPEGARPGAGAALIRAKLAVLRRRRGYFPLAPADPAWTMLLELYAAHLEGRQLHQASLGLASGVPKTTALRLTRRFLEAGLCVSGRDTADRRLLLIGLSDSAARRMSDYLQLGGGLEALLS